MLIKGGINGGAEETRTPDLLTASQVISNLVTLFLVSSTSAIPGSAFFQRARNFL